MLLFDMTFTAFWVPMSVGFCSTYYGKSFDHSCTWVDLIGGAKEIKRKRV
jgi:hypothetical protein